MNDPENIIAAIYRAVGWINAEANSSWSVVEETKDRSNRLFVERAQFNKVSRNDRHCGDTAVCGQKEEKIVKKS
jgi:hypothetical protein